ncbi:MAG: hypothetical protein ACYDCK_08390 [Thermoplasmatota archaeon]
MPKSNRSRSARAKRAALPQLPPQLPAIGGPASVRLDDVLQVQRRYVVDGVLTCVSEIGRFRGVQVLGSVEHLVLEDAKKREVHMIPLPTVSEIVLKQRSIPRDEREAFDPSFA